MRSIGATILSAFAAIWAFLGLHLSDQAVWIQVLPFALSGLLIILALGVHRNAMRPSPEMRKRIGRTVMIWSLVEGVLIFAGVNILHNTGHAEWTLALIAIIVGLHFFPMAIGLNVPIYGLTGLGLIGVALIGELVLPVRSGLGASQDVVIGMGCAGVLYLTALRLIASAPKVQLAATT